MSAITLEDFQQYFTVRVVEYKADADIQSQNINVNFEVRCNLNGRLSIHVTSVDVSNMQTFTENDVLNIAWQQVESNVQDWATTNIGNAPYTTFIPETTTNDISLADLNNNFNIRVYRWELYPKERPTSWCIGFEMTKNVGSQVKTQDCTISTATLCNNTLCNDIMTAAWNSMKESFCSWASQVLTDATVINNVYVPSSLA